MRAPRLLNCFSLSVGSSAENPSDDAPSLPSRKRILALSAGAVLFVALGLCHCGYDKTGQGGSGSRIRSTLHLETFVLNLADPDQRSYLRVGIDLGLNQEARRGEDAPVARVRDTILSVLALSKADELLTEKGKDQLKSNLVHALQERIPELGVEEIYFTEFLIQR